MTDTIQPAPEVDTPAETQTETKPRRSGFQPRRMMRKMDPVAAERQGRITMLAWKKLGNENAIAFLNAHDEALGGRPLDLAVASEEGLGAVERAIESRAAA